jgi:hypothetical protein
LDSDSYKDFAPSERDLVFQTSCKQRMPRDLRTAAKLCRGDHLSRKFSTQGIIFSDLEDWHFDLVFLA